MLTGLPFSRMMCLAIFPRIFAFNFGLEREVCLLSKNNMVQKGNVQAFQSPAESVRRPDIICPGFGFSGRVIVTKDDSVRDGIQRCLSDELIAN